MKGWLDDRRRAPRPAVGAGEAHRGADAGQVLASRNATRRSRCSTCGSRRSSSADPVAAHHGAARPRDRHRLHRHLLRDAVLVGRVVARCCCCVASPVVSLSSRSARALGRVVPRAARARALVQAVPRRGRRARRRERRDGRRWRRSSGTSSSRTSRSACWCSSTRRSIPRASGYHVLQSQIAIGSGGWFGQGLHAGHAEATRVPSGAAHRLHLRRRRRGARLHRRDARAHAVPAALPARDPRRRRAPTTRSAASSRSGCWRAGSCTCS